MDGFFDREAKVWASAFVMRFVLTYAVHSFARSKHAKYMQGKKDHMMGRGKSQTIEIAKKRHSEEKTEIGSTRLGMS